MLSKEVDPEKKRTSKRKKCPIRGKRYSKAQKEQILKFAKANSVEEAAVKFHVTGSSIYEWRRALDEKGDEKGDGFIFSTSFRLEKAGRWHGRRKEGIPENKSVPFFPFWLHSVAIFTCLQGIL